MKIQFIKSIASNRNLVEEDLSASIRVLEALANSRGISEQELDIIGEFISNIEGAKVVWEDHIHYGTSLSQAINAFMKRITNISK